MGPLPNWRNWAEVFHQQTDNLLLRKVAGRNCLKTFIPPWIWWGFPQECHDPIPMTKRSTHGNPKAITTPARLPGCPTRHRGWGGGWSTRALQDEGETWAAAGPRAKLYPTWWKSRGRKSWWKRRRKRRPLGVKTDGVKPKPGGSLPTSCRNNGWPDIRTLIKPDQVSLRSLSQGSLSLFSSL